jgi:glycosyltransferase involved in cell wall biosynthesis
LHEPVYNNAFIIKALASLLREGKVTVTFPSFGSLYDQFKRQAAEISTTGIEFYDKMPRHRFLKFMSGFDLYLSASRSDSSPVSLIEAMALGLIPIAADIPGVAEWLTPDSGYLFPENDTGSLEHTIEKIIDDADPHESMRQTSLERVETTAIFESSIAEQIKVMKQLAGRNNV